MTTPGTAANSDARKRNAERDTDQPPNLSELAEYVKRVSEAGPAATEALVAFLNDITGWDLTPPLPRPEPWRVLSDDPDRPTLATVEFEYTDDKKTYEVTSMWWVEGRALQSQFGQWTVDAVVDVRLIHAYDPETHVPVERALIEEAFDFIVEHGEGAPTDLERRLRAALADGAES